MPNKERMSFCGAAPVRVFMWEEQTGA